ncbi:MAG: F0F1 ATP synthase subunit A [Geminicoccaceae bacterium]
MAGPLEQFEVTPILPIQVAGLDLSFTNASLWMGLSVLCVYLVIMLGTQHASLVPSRFQSVVELLYEFVAGMIRDSAGKEGMRYFPVIFTLFTLILYGNLLGMVPGSFTFTSHIIVTFALALAAFAAVTVLGFVLHGAHFLHFFVPPGAPWYMLPLLVPIEVLSYFIRPISLSVRLFVNMMAGHILLKLFAGFTIALGVFGIVPLVVAIGITGLEFVIAFLQAYVFTVLVCIYLRDAIHLH